jgi:lipopolysaccharide biosynthesis glycosyltransferase
MKDIMHIAFGVDDKYVMPLGVLIKSILLTNPQQKIVFHVLAEKLSAKNKKLLSELCASSSVHISFYNITRQDIGRFNKYSFDYAGSITTYFRLLLPELLPEVNKVLYLDSDILVVGSLTGLWKTDLAGQAAAAVIDYALGDDVHKYNITEYKLKNGYYNAGVLLLNLTYWRKNAIGIKLMTALCRNESKYTHADQDVINHVLKNVIKQVPAKYNCMLIAAQLEDCQIRKERYKDILAGYLHPVIIHFAGAQPWYKETKHPYKDLWLLVKTQTPWRHAQLSHKYFNLRLLKPRLKKLRRLLGLTKIEQDNKIDLNKAVAQMRRKLVK